MSRKKAYRMSPCARTGGQVSPTRIPLRVGQCIMISSSEVLDPAAPFFFGRAFPSPNIIEVEVKIPELQLGFT